MTEVGIEKVLSRLEVPESIKVGFPSKNAQVKDSMKIFEKTRDGLKLASLAEQRQRRDEVSHEDRLASSNLCN